MPATLWRIFTTSLSHSSISSTKLEELVMSYDRRLPLVAQLAKASAQVAAEAEAGRTKAQRASASSAAKKRSEKRLRRVSDEWMVFEDMEFPSRAFWAPQQKRQLFAV